MKRNTKSVGLEQPLDSKTTILSSCCDVGCQHSHWSSNRSYFLRVTENRRKQHRKEWEQKQKKMSFVTVPSGIHRDRAVQELQNELSEANHKIKAQAKEILCLRKKIYMACAAENVIKRGKQLFVEADANSDQLTAVSIYKPLPCEVPEDRDEKGHGDETVDGSLVVEVCGSIPARAVKSFEQEESLPNEAGDITNVFSKACDQGYFSLPRRTGSFTVSSPKIPTQKLPTPTTFSVESTCYHNSLADYSDSSVFSFATPNDNPSVHCESVGCQTDLMLFTTTSDELNNTLILLQTSRNPNAPKDPSRGELISNMFLEVVPNVLIVSALWRNSHGHIIDLELLLRRYVLPTLKRWFN